MGDKSGIARGIERTAREGEYGLRFSRVGLGCEERNDGQGGGGGRMVVERDLGKLMETKEE